MKKQSGFTLIELMIVVAIVAILAAIALPAYQTYAMKAKFTEVVSATGPFKSAIEVCYQSQGGMTANCASGSNGVPSDLAAGQTGFLDSVAWVPSGTSAGTITATGDAATFGATNNVYKLIAAADATGKITWTASGSCKTGGLC